MHYQSLLDQGNHHPNKKVSSCYLKDNDIEKKAMKTRDSPPIPDGDIIE